MLGIYIPMEKTSRNTNPFMQIYKKRRYKTGQRSLMPSQVRDLLSVIPDLVHLGMLQLAIVTGIRREDIVRIKVKDINFEKNQIMFYESKKARMHTVFIPSNVTNTLKMILNINKGETYIFPGRSDRIHSKGHMSGRNAYNILDKYLVKAGLKKRPFHALRATCIKMCQAKGWSIEQTAEHVGDTIAVIQGHYTTPSEEEMKAVANEKPIL